MTFTIADHNRSFARLGDARKFADKTAARVGTSVQVVNLDENTVAYMATDVEGTFSPWTRVETPKFAVPFFEGFYPAYTRRRIQAVVYRAYDADSDLNWRVYDSRTGNHLDVATTKEACQVTKEMGKGRQL